MIQVDRISKTFVTDSGALLVFNNLSFKCQEGTVTALVGPSGCGKSTLLAMIAGVEPIDSGSVSIPAGATLGYMMQSDLLLPWRTLEENAMLGVEIVGLNKNTTGPVVQQYFEAFDLGDSRSLYPIAASAGMRQRAALVRTLAVRPNVVLLDEPFSHLDFDVRIKIQAELIKYFKKSNATVLLVTHEIDDAIALADRVIILSERPTRIKTTIPIDAGLKNETLIHARETRAFRETFSSIVRELKYLPDNTI